MRIFLECGERWIELQPGESILGRDTCCPIQIDDESLSRRHLRFRFVPAEGRVNVEDLMSTNGTWLNDMLLCQQRELRDGDVLVAATRAVAVHIVEDDDPRLAEMVAWATGRRRRKKPKHDSPTTSLTTTCPRCQAPLATAAEPCARCEEARVARLDKTPPLDRRREPRIQISLPVRYKSATARFSSCVCDISMGGVFIASRRSEVPVTPCRITIKPRSGPSFTAEGEVCHVVQEDTALGRPPGFGIKFTALEYRGRQWIYNAIRDEMTWFHDTSPGG